MPEWDSLVYLQLIGEIEDPFDIMLEIKEEAAGNCYSVTRLFL